MIKNVTYFDAEWSNNINKSICQIGLVCEDFTTGEPFFPEQDIYINPEDGFNDICVRIHGITRDRVAEERTFPEVWKEVSHCFTNAVVIGHNVKVADLNALEKTLTRYNIDIPEFMYIDTLEIARDVLPLNVITDYSLSSLCKYYQIEIDHAHDAFDDACACKDVLSCLLHDGLIDLERYVRKYESHSDYSFSTYASSPQIRKAITDYYGIVKGIMADNVITDEERNYLAKWKNENSEVLAVPELQRLVNYIDEALSDGILTEAEKCEINTIISNYYSTIKAAPETTATQVLDGILRGISADNVITEQECRQLQNWLYDNSFLKGHFPYDKVFSLVEEVLEDNVVTKEESDYLQKEITAILNPVEELRTSVETLVGKTVCLSGNFKYGQKSAVAEYILSKGGIVEDSVKRKTDILVVGDLDCEAYSNGTYGTKVKKAIEFNSKGSHITIMKEADLFQSIS